MPPALGAGGGAATQAQWAAQAAKAECPAFQPQCPPWDPGYGKIFAYTTASDGSLNSYDTGITLTPGTNWHVFDVRADPLNRVWAGVAVDNHWNPLTNLPLARIYHPDWGPDLSLILTAESVNAYPGSTNPLVTQWTTQFKDPKLDRPG